MNIFILDRDAATAARMMCDKHVIKMILESCQLLSTAHHVLDGEELYVNTGKRKYKTYICTKKNICKATMVNHPCTIWARETRANYIWLWRHAYALCKEYTRRYNKIHAMEHMLMNELHDPPENIQKNGLTPFAQAMQKHIKTTMQLLLIENIILKKNQNLQNGNCKMSQNGLSTKTLHIKALKKNIFHFNYE